MDVEAYLDTQRKEHNWVSHRSGTRDRPLLPAFISASLWNWPHSPPSIYTTFWVFPPVQWQTTRQTASSEVMHAELEARKKAESLLLSQSQTPRDLSESGAYSWSNSLSPGQWIGWHCTKWLPTCSHYNHTDWQRGVVCRERNWVVSPIAGHFVWGVRKVQIDR